MSTHLVSQILPCPPRTVPPVYSHIALRVMPLKYKSDQATPLPKGCIGFASLPGSEDTLEKRQATHSSILGLLVTLLVKNLPAMQETWVQSLGWEDPLEEGKDTHSSILARRIPWNV